MPFARRHWPALVILAAVAGYVAWYYTRGKTDLSGVSFAVPDAGVTVRFPDGPPTESDLSLDLIDPDRPRADAMTRDVRAFQRDGGTIRGWVRDHGQYRLAVRTHLPPADQAGRVKLMTERLLDAPGSAGSVVSNWPVIEERQTDVKGRPGRVVLYDGPSGNRTAAMFFVADGTFVFLMVGKTGTDLAFDDQNLNAFFASVEFPPK
jgi:hypothetical protein